MCLLLLLNFYWQIGIGMTVDNNPQIGVIVYDVLVTVVKVLPAKWVWHYCG